MVRGGLPSSPENVVSTLSTSISVSLFSSAFSYTIAQLFGRNLLTFSPRLFVRDLVASFYLVIVFIVAPFHAFGKHLIALRVAVSVVRIGVITAFSGLRLRGDPSANARLLLINSFALDMTRTIRHRIARINGNK